MATWAKDIATGWLPDVVVLENLMAGPDPSDSDLDRRLNRWERTRFNRMQFWNRWDINRFKHNRWRPARYN